MLLANNSWFSQESLRISVPSTYCCYLFTFRHWSNWWQVRCEPYVQMYRDARAVHNCVPKRILSPFLNTQIQWHCYHLRGLCVCLCNVPCCPRIGKVEPIKSVKSREGRHVKMFTDLFSWVRFLKFASRYDAIAWSPLPVFNTYPTFKCTKWTYMANPL